MTINPLLEFARYAGDPRKAAYIYDVDLALQPSMCTKTTQEQRDAMWDLYNLTDGGVLIFTGRSPQSSNTTFGHDYPGAFEHGTLARFGLGHTYAPNQSFLFMAPKINVEKMAGLSAQAIAADGSIRLAETPEDIRQSSDRAVYVEKKNASIALVHTTLVPKFDGDPAPLEHLKEVRRVLEPIAAQIIKEMGLRDTHHCKAGNDAVEMIPNGLDHNSEAKQLLSTSLIKRLEKEGLSKQAMVHVFQEKFFQDRVFHMLGDGALDMDVVLAIKNNFDGKGTYVSNGVPLQEKYKDAVDHTIPHYSMSWPTVIDTTRQLFDAMPKAKMPLPAAGGMVPDFKNLG